MQVWQTSRVPHQRQACCNQSSLAFSTYFVLQVWQTSTGHLLAVCHFNGKHAALDALLVRNCTLNIALLHCYAGPADEHTQLFAESKHFSRRTAINSCSFYVLLQVWQTSTGHLLAECHINGKRAGWMILDTGASGFVIEPGVADQYELPTFGDLRIAGVAGKVSGVKLNWLQSFC
jgi:predicted aspartyl protease